MIYIDDAALMMAEFRHMKMSHMWSDVSVEELHTFAKRLGLKRQWFQCRMIAEGREAFCEEKSKEKYGRGLILLWPLPHYDVSMSVRLFALQDGAKPLEYGTNQEWVDACNRGCLTHPQRVAWLKRVGDQANLLSTELKNDK